MLQVFTGSAGSRVELSESSTNDEHTFSVAVVVMIYAKWWNVIVIICYYFQYTNSFHKIEFQWCLNENQWAKDSERKTMAKVKWTKEKSSPTDW
jgi:hypothetical protein